MLIEYYNKIVTYLTQTLGANFIFLVFIFTTVGAIAYFIVISCLVTQLDKRYFIRNRQDTKLTNEHSSLSWRDRSLSYIINCVKIIIGIGLLVCGIVMLILPGQGLLTILIGLSLIPFPGKDKLEQYILSLKSVRASLNWIRIKANKEPFIF